MGVFLLRLNKHLLRFSVGVLVAGLVLKAQSRAGETWVLQIYRPELPEALASLTKGKGSWEMQYKYLA